MPTTNLVQLTAIIKTFERPKCLARLLDSIQKFYPDLRIIVADDSLANRPLESRLQDLLAPTHRSYLRLPADIGLSAGRNAMLARVRTPYFLLLDDDLQFYRHTRLESLLQHVASGQRDLVAGELVHCRKKLLFVSRNIQPVHGTFHVEDGQLTMRRGGVLVDDGILKCDLVHNFYVARTDRIRAMGGWDPDLKLDEQEEFFFRARQFNLRIGMCPEIKARHWGPRRSSSQYTEYRSRCYKNLAVDKMGLKRLVDYDGQAIGALPKDLAA